MNKHHYATTETYLPGPDGRLMDFGELETDISLEHSSEHLPTSSSAPPTTGSTAGVIAARVLAVLVVAMVITSIIGFTIFDRQAGNSATAIASLAIGGAAAVLGLNLGFLKAYQS